MAKRSEDQKATASPKKKPKKAPLSDAEKYVHPTPIERQAVDAENTFSMAYWNMGGIRSSLQKRPELFERLLETTNRPEVIVLAEHKLQPVEKDVKAVEKDLAAIFPGYRCIWNCSVRKGYSGVVALVREEVLSLKPAALSNTTVEVETPPENSKKYQILSCHRGLGIPPIQSDYNTEGRVLTLNFSRPNFYLVVSYVPNSGAGLKRLDYRIGTWESDCREYLKKLSEEKPVAYIGDMNVAHLDLDIWNPEAKHLEKNAGTTTIERNAFTQMLEDCDFVDGFRHFHPEAKGNYTFWSVRARNRPHNRGLRLDYTLVSKDMVREQESGGEGVRLADAYIAGDVCASHGDHCAIAMVLEY